MRQPKQILLLSIVLLLAFAAGANAQVTWTVNGTFNDGGTLSGSFTYDATTNTYSNINVTTTSGSAFAGATYTFTDPYLESAANELILSTTTGGLKDKPVLDLAFFPILTNAGGTAGLKGGGEALCTDSRCETDNLLRTLTTLTAVGTSDDSASWWFWYVRPFPPPVPVS